MTISLFSKIFSKRDRAQRVAANAPGLRAEGNSGSKCLANPPVRWLMLKLPKKLNSNGPPVTEVKARQNAQISSVRPGIVTGKQIGRAHV